MTSPVNAPTKLVDEEPVTSSPVEVNVAAVPTLTRPVTDRVAKVDNPVGVYISIYVS